MALQVFVGADPRHWRGLIGVPASPPATPQPKSLYVSP